MRAFARSLGTDHATLSQIIRGRRAVTSRTIRSLAPALGLTKAEVTELCLRAYETAVVEAIGDPRFRPNSRWLSIHLGIPLDDINLTLHRLLRANVIALRSATTWICLESDPPCPTR